MSIFICDSIMGSGKTSAAINYINQHHDKRFIYITPYLDEDERIVVQNIKEFSVNNVKSKTSSVIIDITELDEKQKDMLRGAIKFFTGDKVNTKISVIDKTDIKPCGAIYMTDSILEQFKEIVGEENVKIDN